MTRYLPEDQIRILETPEIKCSDVEALLGDYVEGEIIPSLKERLAEHIRGCHECKSLEFEYKMIIELAPELKDCHMPAGIRTRLYRGLNRRLGTSLSHT